jgi:hypothetical protein
MLMQKSRVLDEILRLDPERDHQRILYLSISYDFPWDTTRSLEFALFRTYCVPRMTRILVSTGEFTQRAQKRYDDTVLILAEMLEHGYDSERGRAAMRIISRLHSLYPIENVDFLYTLSTFIFEPVRWNARFGWRPLSAHEKLAAYCYWRAVGRRMNIKDIPGSYDAFEQFNLAYEREHFQYGETNRHIADKTLEVFLSWYPRVLSPVVAAVIYSLLDEPVRAAHDWPRPSELTRRLVVAGLKARAAALRYLPRRRRPHLLTEVRHRTYRRGYNLTELGAAAAHGPIAREQPGRCTPCRECCT